MGAECSEEWVAGESSAGCGRAGEAAEEASRLARFVQYFGMLPAQFVELWLELREGALCGEAGGGGISRGFPEWQKVQWPQGAGRVSPK